MQEQLVPDYVDNLDNLIRFGGLYADPRQCRHPPDSLLAHPGLQGGAMMARARDDIFTMADLRQEDRLTSSLNTIKNDWWRIQEHAGIELMLG